MKKLILLLFLAAAGTTQAQTVKKDANGNYITIRQTYVKDTVLRATGHTYTDSKGKVYPVYISQSGKLFVMRTSAKGNVYKMYLKLN